MMKISAVALRIVAYLAMVALGSGPLRSLAEGTSEVSAAASVVGRYGDIVMVRTVDGGYRCASQDDLALPSDQISQMSTGADVVAIYRTHEICDRLRQTPDDAILLAALGKTAVGILDANAFCHYVAIYCVGCLCEGDTKRSANAMQAIRSKDPQSRWIALFTTLTTSCALCAGTGHSRSDPAQVCAACAGKGSVAVKWKATRVFHELVRDGDMSMVALQAELDRSDPPKNQRRGAQKQLAALAVGDAASAPLEETPAQVINNPQLSGKMVIVSAKVAQVKQLPDGSWLVTLEGNLRCKVKHGMHKGLRIENQQVQIQGTVVPRSDIVTTSSPHMIDCALTKP